MSDRQENLPASVGSSKPQIYVRMMVEFSYPAPKGANTNDPRVREMGGVIRRAIEGRLQSEGLRAQLDGSAIELRAMVMRQEDSAALLGAPVMPGPGGGVAGEPGEPVALTAEEMYSVARPGVEVRPVRPAQPARPGIGCWPPSTSDGGQHPRGGSESVQHEPDDIPPNAGSAS